MNHNKLKKITKLTCQTNTKPQNTLAKTSDILKCYTNEPNFILEFNYKSIIRKLNYLEYRIRSDIACAIY